MEDYLHVCLRGQDTSCSGASTSLNKDPAIQAIRRLATRREYTNQVISDSETHFKEDEKELRKSIDTFDNEQLKTYCAGKREFFKLWCPDP